MFDLDMGRYALFIWPAWAITVGVLAAVVVRCLSESRRWQRQLDREQERDR